MLPLLRWGGECGAVAGGFAHDEAGGCHCVGGGRLGGFCWSGPVGSLSRRGNFDPSERKNVDYRREVSGGILLGGVGATVRPGDAVGWSERPGGGKTAKASRNQARVQFSWLAISKSYQ